MSYREGLIAGKAAESFVKELTGEVIVEKSSTVTTWLQLVWPTAPQRHHGEQDTCGSGQAFSVKLSTTLMLWGGWASGG